MRELSGRTAVVTGAASGIGLALARRFAAERMKVVLADVEEGALDAAAGQLADGGAEVLAVPTDVSDAASVDALAAASVSRFGAVHVVCNNAGVGGGGLSWEAPLSMWEWVLGVNLWGVIHGIHSFVPLLVEQGEGHVVNTASMAGLLAGPGMGPYTASKHAVVGISESLHHELAASGSAVRVSVLCPGWVKTNIADSDRNWLDRLGERPGTSDAAALEAVRERGRAMLAAGMPPDEVAGLVHDAIVAERFWVFTDEALVEMAVGRFQRAAAGQNP